MSEYFEAAAKVSGDARSSANWVMGDVAACLKEDGRDIADSPVSAGPSGGADRDGRAKARLTGKLAKEIFPKMFATGEAAGDIAEREGLKAISDTSALDKIVDEVIAANPKQVEQYKGGKTTVIGFFVGQVMKASRGQANPQVVGDILRSRLS